MTEITNLRIYDKDPEETVGGNFVTPLGEPEGDNSKELAGSIRAYFNQHRSVMAVDKPPRGTRDTVRFEEVGMSVGCGPGSVIRLLLCVKVIGRLVVLLCTAQ